MANLSDKVIPSGVASAAQGTLADSALQPSDNLTSANLTGALPAISGAALTSLTSANLTGALPAIDGSALIGVVASTTAGAVGTYAMVFDFSSILHSVGATVAGSTLSTWEAYSSTDVTGGVTSVPDSITTSAVTFSGTWQWMSQGNLTGARSRFGLAVRIS
jgi:hypothetical protein